MKIYLFKENWLVPELGPKETIIAFEDINDASEYLKKRSKEITDLYEDKVKDDGTYVGDYYCIIKTAVGDLYGAYVTEITVCKKSKR